MGYAIIAMESLSYPSEKIREAVREMDAAMDAFDLEESKLITYWMFEL